MAATHATGRPILIGTLDVAESERLAGELGRAGLRVVVLNAKNDAQEAAIVAEAGAYGAVTVSTQMAGRGTDIRLGGTGGDRDLIAGLGGLHVIGTGRHASCRLDHQLRGRAGRQGDPGGSVFFASMEDELILAVRARRGARPGRRREGALGASATRSALPRASTWRSTGAPGGTTSSSRSSGASSLSIATGCCGPTTPCRRWPGSARSGWRS